MILKRDDKNDDGDFDARAFDQTVVNVRVVISVVVLISYTFRMYVFECIDNMLRILLQQQKVKGGH